MAKNMLDFPFKMQITLFLCSSSLWTLQSSVIQAQIIPDNTLGTESSIVNQLNDKLQQIEGGAIRGGNLFHSFQEFSILEGNSAYFVNPVGILNILTRVTGDNPSNIFGTLGVLGGANLYLINPNGIIFGANAQLDLTGSFYASTAPSLILPDGSLYSATNPQAPPLLRVTATAPIGLVMEGQTGDIINQGNLKVGQGQTLYLNGRNVSNTGNLTASGGNIFVLGENINLDGDGVLDVSAVTGGGNIYVGSDPLLTAKNTYIGENVTLNADGLLTGNGGNVIIYGEDLTTFKGNITARGGIISGNGGFVEVSGKENLIFRGNVDASAVNGLAGTLLIDPENITIKNGSGEDNSTTIYEDNLENLSGNINVILEADNDIIIEDLADNELTFQQGLGTILFKADADNNNVGSFLMVNDDIIQTNGRNIQVYGVDLTLANIDSSPLSGQGLGGNINLNSTGDIFISGGNITTSTEGSNVVGGNIDIKTNSLFLTNGARIFALNRGQEGQTSGTIQIDAMDRIVLSGVSNLDGKQSLINSAVARGSVGHSGGIIIKTKTLFLNDGAGIGATTFGIGNAGDIKIKATDSVSLSGIASNGFGSSIQSIVSNQPVQAIGNAGKIEIITGSLFLNDGASLSTTTFGKGNAGLIEITAQQTISLSGENNLGFNSSFFSQVGRGGQGNSEGIKITTGSLFLNDGAFISADTFGKGNAGAVEIQATDTITLSGESSSQFGSQISTIVGSTAEGNSGGIKIKTGSLFLNDGAFLSSNTRNIGNAGAIEITANDTISLSGIDSAGFSSEIASDVRRRGVGISGGIKIKTNVLSMTDNAIISTRTVGQGTAGNLEIIANTLEATKNSEIASSSNSDFNAGNINLRIANLNLDDSRITASTTGKGNAGLITISNAQNITLNQSEITASTSGEGNTGEINLTASNNIQLTNNSEISSSVQQNATGNAQQIILNSPNINLNNSTISAETAGKGSAGSITFIAPNLVTLDNNSNLTVETSGAGKPGNIDITTHTLTIGQNAQLSATATQTSTNPEGGGSITLNTDTLNIAGRLGIFAETQGITPAGNLSINSYITPNLDINFTNDGFISARTTAQGNGGNITIYAPQTLDISGKGSITAETLGSGNAGNINFTSQTVNLSDGININASTLSDGNAGNINFNANQYTLNNAQISSFTDGNGNAGQINFSYQGNNAQSITLNSNSIISTEILSNGNANIPSNITLQTDNLTLNNSIITANTAGKGDAGNITIPNAININLNNSEITASTSGEGDTGEIKLNASNTLQLNQSNISSSVEQGAIGNSQQISLNTPNINLKDSEITAATAGNGNSGNIETLNTQTLTLDQSTISTAIAPTGIATQPSNITLNTQQLNLLNNSEITASTSGKGDAGNITIPNAININLSQSEITASTSGEGDTGEIKLNASDTLQLNQSNISSSVEQGAIGNSQQISLNTPNINLKDSEITAATAGNGNSGNIETLNTQTLTLDQSTISTAIAPTGIATQPSNITLNTQQLNLINNSEITTSTSGKGDAGNITIPNAININLSQSEITASTSGEGKGGNINLTGNTLSLNQGSQIRTTTSSNNNAGNINLKFTDEIYLTGENTGIFANTTQNSTGNSGNIFIDPINVIIENGAIIAVDSQGSGEAGNITLLADNLTLNRGFISAQSTSGDGGNIFLDIANRLTLLNNSLISTTAGNQQQGGNGGNITIFANSIFTFPNDNSDITANAFSGRGGNINITTQEILWIQPRNLLTPFSDITASSELGAQGVITINDQNTQPPEDTVTINAEFVDPNTLIAQNICKKGINSEFVVTGQGGLPLNPTDPLNVILVWEDWGNIAQNQQNSDNHSEISLIKADTSNINHLIQQGKESYEKENYDNAIKLWENGLKLLEKSNNNLKQAEILNYLALAYQKIGNIEQAKKASANSINLLKSQPKNSETLSLLARALNNQGVLQLTWGQSESALESFKQATTLYQQINAKEAENKTILNQVYALKDLGRNQAAIALLNPLYQQQQNQPNSSLKADIYRLYGEIAYSMGQDKLSDNLLQQSLTIAQNSLNKDKMASVALSLGNINQIGNNSQANNYYQQASQSETSLVKLLSLINQFSANVRQNQVTEATQLIPTISAKINQLPPSRFLIYAQINYALSLYQLSQQTPSFNLSPSDSIEILNNALKMAQQIGDKRGEAYALGYLGKISENQKQWSSALNFTQKALSLSQQLQASDLIYQWQWQLGRILQHQNQKEQALIAYQSAYQEIQSLRQNLAGINPERQFSFKETVEPLYRELVSQLLDDTPSQTNLQQARQIIESLQLAELDNFFQDGCTLAKPQQIDQIDPNAAVIYPIILKDRISVIISYANQPLDYYSIPLTENEIKQTIDNLYITLNPKIDPKPLINSQNPLKPHQTLYDWLIRPLESKLAQNKVNTLVFVLDQGLQNIPPAILHDGQQYLIEKYNVVLTPGLQLLDSESLTTQGLNSVLGGLAEARQGFSALAGVKQELESISQEINSDILLNEDFNRSNLQQQINNSNSPIVHLATHGQFSSQAERTFLVVWDGLINVKELGQLLENRKYSPTPIELLILSACQTAQGDNRATLGLAGVAVRSGARSTLATLWSVQDESTAELMIKFYEILENESVNKAEALRKAQLALIYSEKYNHPYYWGAFVLVGNWK